MAINWGVQPSCCDQPAIGPVSPEIVPSTSSSEDGLEGLEDGFYDVSVGRVPDRPAILVMAVRQWVSCADLPGRCLPDAPEEGIVGDPDTEVTRTVFTDEQLTVMIRTLGDPRGPAVGIRGSGTALYELLRGSWCEGYPDTPVEVNCGIDMAFTDWIWEPYQAGMSLEEIEAQIARRGTEETFPLRAFVHEPDLPDCAPDRGCLYAYRGPHETNLVVTPGLVQIGEWPGYELFGWWTSLQIENGSATLYIDTAQIAG